ncbi:MAG: hypothetical protein AAGF12_15785 [Myxococcota bacterium]
MGAQLSSWFARLLGVQLFMLGACGGEAPVDPAVDAAVFPDRVVGDSAPDGAVVAPEAGVSDSDVGVDAEVCATRCDGECVDSAHDWRHCGGCGRPCGSAEACVSGVCRAIDTCSQVLDIACDDIPDGTLSADYRSVANFFGAVSLDGDRLAVGMRGGSSDGTAPADNSVTFAGEVFVYRRDRGAWVQEAWIPSPFGAGENFGASVVLADDNLFVGAPAIFTTNVRAYDPVAAEARAAAALRRSYLGLDRDGDGWVTLAEWPASAAATFPDYDIDGNGRISEAEYIASFPPFVPRVHTERTLEASPGRVVHYRRVADGDWVVAQVIDGDDDGDLFGSQIWHGGDTLLIRADREDGAVPTRLELDGDPDDNLGVDTGAFYVYRRGPDGWMRDALVRLPHTIGTYQRRAAVAPGGRRFVIGHLLNDPDRGQVYVLDRRGDEWTLSDTITSSAGDGRRFGHAVALHDDRLAIGVTSRRSGAGEVDVYRWTRGEWKLESTVRAPNGEPRDAFGFTLELSNELLVVGAGGEDAYDVGAFPPSRRGLDGDVLNPVGAVYVYRWQEPASGPRWVLGAYLKPSTLQISSEFSQRMSLSGSGLAVSSLDLQDFRSAGDHDPPLPHGYYERAVTTPLGPGVGETYLYRLGQ